MAKIVKISKEEASRRLGDVPGEKCFWCQDGKVARNLKQLEEDLNGMSDETFRYHSREDRNDSGSKRQNGSRTDRTPARFMFDENSILAYRVWFLVVGI